MKEIEAKTFECCRYIIETGATIRETAKEFNISKSSVHANIHKFMPQIDKQMYAQVAKILEKHFKEKHLHYRKIK